MKWIGLTGGIATGKSTVARILREHGFPVVNADELARQAVANGTPAFDAVVARFGNVVVAADGDLDRKKLGEVVFQDSRARADLEAIVHPVVRAEQRRLRDELAASGASLAFYDVPLLFEKNLDADFDASVAVICDEATQLSRLVARDGYSLDEAKRRIASQ
ncbi:MAG: dephospho-CoA kinase, partial [Bdellovibrionaceae bacterium]|nr:dephospho-CoA kinase [Pseudobdellovibrionaceae bacterium]